MVFGGLYVQSVDLVVMLRSMPHVLSAGILPTKERGAACSALASLAGVVLKGSAGIVLTADRVPALCLEEPHAAYDGKKCSTCHECEAKVLRRRDSLVTMMQL